MDELKDQNNSLSPQNKSIVFQPVIINDESILKLHFVESNSIEGFENGNDKINRPENSPINNTQSNKEIKTSVIRETDSPDNNGDSTIRNSILSNQNSMLLSPSVG